MSDKCRDCGWDNEPGGRGCPQCALNLEAEAMIDRFILRRLLPVVVVAFLFAGALYYLIR